MKDSWIYVEKMWRLNVKIKKLEIILYVLRIDINATDIKAKQPNSAIRKGTRVQLIKNGKKTIVFMPNHGYLCYFKEALIAGFEWFPIPYSRWWRSLRHSSCYDDEVEVRAVFSSWPSRRGNKVEIKDFWMTKCWVHTLGFSFIFKMFVCLFCLLFVCFVLFFYFSYCNFPD